MSTSNSEYDRERRQIRRFERLGSDIPQCVECGESNSAALTGEAPNILCYECQAKHAGRSRVEKHHPSGRHNSPATITFPGNDHRILSDSQQDWPIETLRNPNGSPLLKAAAGLRACLDILRLLIERILGWIPPFLESLDERLILSMGESWWVELDLNVGVA